MKGVTVIHDLVEFIKPDHLRFFSAAFAAPLGFCVRQLNEAIMCIKSIFIQTNLQIKHEQKYRNVGKSLERNVQVEGGKM